VEKVDLIALIHYIQYDCVVELNFLILILQVKDFSAEYDGQTLDPELFLVETDKEYDVESSEHPFDYNEWTLKPGLKVIDLLKMAAGINGHLMRLVIADIASLCSQPINFSNHVRPEVWGIVRCGLKVAKPKWCEEHEYVEIQKTIKRRSIINPPKFVASLLKNVHFIFVIFISIYDYSVSQIFIKLCNYRSLSRL
jgi:hypothetical protein